MPDEHPLSSPSAPRSAETLTLRQADQARTDFDAIESDLEAIIERPSRLPTRKEMALRPFYIMVGSAGIVIAWIELFWQHCK